VSLELADECQRKKSRPLSASLAYVDVDLSRAALTSEVNVQSDAAPYVYDSSRRGQGVQGMVSDVGGGVCGTGQGNCLWQGMGSDVRGVYSRAWEVM